MTDEDYDWQPPTTAELKVIQARRERSDKISQLMGDYLLKGYKMLGTSCAECSTILMRDRQGVDYCIACNELDSDVNKDNPVNPAAALSQTREQQQRSSSNPVFNDDVLPSTSTVVNHPPVTTNVQLPRQPLSRREPVRSNESSSQVQSSLQAVEEKLHWATEELKHSTSIESSIQLCNLIRTSAETITSLKQMQRSTSFNAAEQE
ncbi:protein ZNRD2-like isoform X3 [Tubulanus polymorphus]|uniref:protein ZNRD2-like isoform X3 n=1 Tax=Tubulanus polymorphus TaxID=672921 RepID=UPI003DA3A26C